MLSLNIWELLWTVVNFFLLYFLLKKLLYDPMIKFMDERQARIDEGLGRERNARELLESESALAESEKDRCRREAKDIWDSAKADYDDRHTCLSKEYRTCSARLRQEMKKTVEEISGVEMERFEAEKLRLAEGLLARLSGSEAHKA